MGKYVDLSSLCVELSVIQVIQALASFLDKFKVIVREKKEFLDIEIPKFFSSVFCEL